MISTKVYMLISCSTVLIIIALAMKIVSVSFSFSQLTSNWNTFISWLTPSYLYLIVNAIIIGIAASSRFHRDGADDPFQLVDAEDHTEHFVRQTKMIEYSPKYGASEQPRVYEHRVQNNMDEEVIKPMVFRGFPVTEADLAVPEAEYEDNDYHEVVISNSTWTPSEKIIEPSDQILLPAEKSLVSSRSSHRKPVKTSHPEGGGRALRLSKSRRLGLETLEDAWKMITEGRSGPLNCDTWENHGRDDEMEASPTMKKLETFKARTNYQKLAPVKMTEKLIRKEPWLSQDELNKRTEAFINKFNEDLRLQRKQYLQQYTKTITRGSHQ